MKAGEWKRLCETFTRVPSRFSVSTLREASDREHALPIIALAFAPDGNTIAASGGGLIPGSADIRTYAAGTRELLHVCRHHWMGVFDLAFDPVTGVLASASHDYSVVLWNLDEKDAIFLVGEEDSAISRSCVAFFAGSVVVGGGMTWHDDRATLTAFDLGSGKQSTLMTFPEGRGAGALSVAPGGNTLAVSSYAWRDDSVSRVGTVHTFDADLRPHGHFELAFEILDIAACSNDRVAVIANPDEKTYDVRVIDARSGSVNATRRLDTDSAGHVAAAANGALLAVSCGSKLCTLRSDDLAVVWETDLGEDVCSVAWSPDDRLIAVGTYEGTVRLFDAASAKELRPSRNGKRG